MAQALIGAPLLVFIHPAVHDHLLAFGRSSSSLPRRPFPPYRGHRHLELVVARARRWEHLDLQCAHARAQVGWYFRHLKHGDTVLLAGLTMCIDGCGLARAATGASHERHPHALVAREI
eukprot:981083-Prymnesium_polylepis.3